MEVSLRFTPGTQWIRSWVGTDMTPDTLAKIKFPAPARNRKFGHEAHSLVTTLTELSRLLIHLLV
jgi:hypothetical protein